MTGQFDASASMLGYLFQVRLALLGALERVRRFGTFTITIETLDDIAFDETGAPLELLQVKHTLRNAGSLADASSELWKTLRIWAHGLQSGRWPSDTMHYLVASGTAAEGSAASYLRAMGRDIGRAKQTLDATAQSSVNQDNISGYRQYLALDDATRTSLLERVVVADRSDDVISVHESLREELGLTVGREQVDSFITRLEGYWFQTVVAYMAGRRGPIKSEEIDAELQRLRNQFRPDNLPIDADIVAFNEIDEAAFASNVFVTQLRLIDLTARRIVMAMRQYYRASEQRSRWLREGFLQLGELADYDRRLSEEWTARFEAMRQELGAEAAEVAMRKAARELYKWAEFEVDLLIRPACNEPFVSRGSLQVLADLKQVGWHPKFLDLLEPPAGDRR